MTGILDYGAFGRRAPKQGVDDLLGFPLTVGGGEGKSLATRPAPVSGTSGLASPVSLAAPASIPPAWLAAGAVGLVLLIVGGRR